MLKLIALSAATAATLSVTSCTKCSKEPEKKADAPAAAAEPVKVADVTDLKIETMKEGAGAPAVAGKKVTVHYTGKLTDGKVFDSSEQRNAPFAFTLGAGQVIQGWEKGVEGMKVGDRRKLIIPPALAYGEKGVGSVIPPNATLVFEVELLNVE